MYMSLCVSEDIIVITDWEPVGFSAWASTSINYDENQVFRFPNVTYNLGGAYSGVTSLFTCPVDGMYAMHVTLLVDDNSDLVADILLDGDVLATVLCDDNESHMCSNMAVFECGAAQQVWVQTVTNADHEALVDDGRHFNTFSGYLISPFNSTFAM